MSLAPLREAPALSRRDRRLIYACYAVSGGLGLVYQVLWLRKLLLVFGSTVHAVSTVLTVFFGGLALGSWLFGWLIDRRGAASGLRWYALLELGIGLYAFATLPLFRAVQGLFLPWYQGSNFSPTVLVTASFACAAVVLLPPTALMGGTFPVLSRYLIRDSGSRGTLIALLYGLNTAGAVVGTIAVYTCGLPVLGLARTLACAGVLNVGIAALCAAVDRRVRASGAAAAAEAPDGVDAASHADPSTRTTASGRGLAQDSAPRADAEGPQALPVGLHAVPGQARWLLAAFALSGFSAMVYEVAWTRALSLILGSSIYAFCIMLAAFLGGMALGSLWVRKDLRAGPATIRQFVMVELVLGGYGMFSLWLFGQLPDWFVAFWPATGGSFAGLVVLQVGLSGMVMLLPTVLMGMLFPMVGDLMTRRFAQLGKRLGMVYAVNTAGGIAGSALSGFLFIPSLGLPGAILIAGVVNLLAGLMLYVRFGEHAAPRTRTAVSCGIVAGALLIALGGLLPGWQRQALAAGVYLNPGRFSRMSVAQAVGQTRLLFYRDSLNATVSVHQSEDTLFLKVGGKTDASTGIDMGTQVLAAHLPLLLVPSADRVLVVGLGSGVTLGQVARYPVNAIHCAELDPAVIEAARLFKAYNGGVHDDPRVRIFTADGRNFLLAEPVPYDVIISEPSNPWMAGVGYLFTEEYYELARARLTGKGLMCQWVQLYSMFPEDVKLLLKTFHHVFPHVTVWSPIPGDLLLVGSMQPQRMSAATLEARMAQPAVREGLTLAHVDRPEQLLELFLFDEEGLEAITADVPWIHEDNQPWIEFSAPKALYAGGTFQMNLDGLAAFKRSPEALIPDYAPPARDADSWSSLADLWMFRQEPKKAIEALSNALRADPQSVALWRRLGQAQLQARQPVQAEESLRRAAAGDDADAAYLLAGLMRQSGADGQAGTWYLEASALRAPDAARAEEIGQQFSQQKAWALAAEFYRSAISQGQAQPRLLLALAACLRELAELPAAERVLREGARLFPRDAALALRLGETLLDEQSPDEAVRWLQAARRLAPGGADAYYGLARAAAARSQHAAARKALRETLRRAPYHAGALRLWREF